MARPETDSLPDDYNPDSVLGALVRAVLDRYDADTFTTAQVANAIAEMLGDGDYATAEDALWSQIGPIVDTIDAALHQHLAAATTT